MRTCIVACAVTVGLLACGEGDDAAPGSTANGPGSGGASSSNTTGPGGGGSAGGSPIDVPCRADGGTHAPNPRLTGLAPGELIDLGPFPCTDPEGDDYNCQQVTDYSGMVYDCKNHQVLMFGGGHATTYTDAMFALDLDTLTWSERYAPTPCTAEHMSMSNFDGDLAAWLSGPSGPYPRPLSRHTYDLLVHVDTIDEFLVLLGPNGDSGSCPPGSTGYDYSNVLAQVAHYDVTENTWSFSSDASGDGHPEYNGGEYPAAELDPISQRVVILGRNGLYVYDPVTREKTVALDNFNDTVFEAELGYANHLVYHPPSDHFVYFNRDGGVWDVVFDRDAPSSSTVTALTESGSAPSHYEPGYAYDAVNHTIGGAITDSVFYSFDPASGAWSSTPLEGNPGTAAFHAVAYDPVNDVFLFVTEDRHTWAYRHAP